jgi:glycerophosphoryl diester phosphodiesterase
MKIQISLTKKISILLLLISGISCKNKTMKDPMIIGHRGAMGYETENTIASLEKAMALGAPMVEIDVFIIASGELVVFHDDQLDRLTNASGPIVDYTWKDLQGVRLSTGQSIPLLSEVIDLLAGKVQLNIELKGPNTALPVSKMVNAAVASGAWVLEDFVISSFDWPLLLQMRLENSSIPLAVLTEEDPLEAIAMATAVNAIAVNPYFKNVDAAVVESIHQAGFKVFTWTVNEPEDLAQMKAFGVDGVFTNYPDRSF